METLVYSIPEAAEVLGISKSYMYMLIKEKKVPYIEIGNRKLVPKTMLEEWIINNTVKAVMSHEINHGSF